MTPTDPALLAAQYAVEHLYGRCLLRLQAHELLMKSVLAGHSLSAPIARIEAAQAARVTETDRKTLGQLVGEMFGTFLVPGGTDGPLDPVGDAPSVAIRHGIAFPPEDYARIEAEHRALVLLRNTLAHQFLAQHDLRTLDGCLAATEALTGALDRVAKAFEELQEWARDMERMRELLAAHLARPDIRSALAGGRIPWTFTTIAQALHEAAMEIAQGDWALVDSARSRIAARHPDERPEVYGCRSWRQVIHESGMFDLQWRPVDGRRQAWYRPKASAGRRPA